MRRWAGLGINGEDVPSDAARIGQHAVRRTPTRGSLGVAHCRACATGLGRLAAPMPQRDRLLGGVGCNLKHLLDADELSGVGLARWTGGACLVERLLHQAL